MTRQAPITFLAELAEEVFGSQQDGEAPDSKWKAEEVLQGKRFCKPFGE